MNSENKKKRILVIGLDGGTFALLSPMIERGLLPNLKRLIENGVCGTLESVVPPVTGPAWVSFMTGNLPERHGIFDFIKSLSDNRSKRVINARDISTKTLWDLLTDDQKTIGVFNVPVTYPPQEVKGFMWTGLLTPPDAGEKMCYPSSLYKELENKVGKFVPDISFRSYKEDEKLGLIRDMTECMKQRGEYTSYLMQRYDWDFFMTVITETDRIQHAFGNYLFNDNLSHQQGHQKEEVRYLIDKFYQEMDAQVGRFCDSAGPHTSIFIVSDHGFGPLSKGFFINQWLHKEGLLVIKDQKRMNLFTRLLLIQQNPIIRSLLRKLDPKGLRKKILRRPASTSHPDVKFDLVLQRYIDWGRTKAYMSTGNQQGIFINVKGRQPMGVVEDGEEYERIREFIIDRLKNIPDPQTGRPIHGQIFKKEEIYPGTLSYDAPDIVFSLDNMKIMAAPVLGIRDGLFFDPFWPVLAYHRMDGIFIASGADVRKGEGVSDARLIDMMPTILYALGVPIPKGLDGKALTHIFTKSFQTSQPVRYTEPDSQISGPKDGIAILSEEENRRVKDALKDLGYL